ncbi:hydrogenase maturation protease [Mycobacterium sp. Aquia_216]|uniref:hydrogenase maturation protease n=1 Tax=Mycobacterium sp. Aquia_216 TaxID=2991729 RepID=UPI00227BB1FE|nr:hydrogenase maturation protease [Mycobacterium sp. Aquia_216]WAJ42896.1 hydrogenase maturation protease [Mycobacterium sp. Aquia_216]
MTADARELRSGVVVVGLGNRYRKDDGVGVVAATVLDELALPHVGVVTGLADPMSLVDAWSGARLAVVIDAAVVTSPIPGRVSRCTLSDMGTGSDRLSSHSVDIGRSYALGQALGRVPNALVVFTIEVADTGHGIGLTPQVEGAVSEVVGRAVAEIKRNSRAVRGSRRSARRLLHRRSQ